MKSTMALLTVASAILLQGAAAKADLPPLIPRDVLFGNPDKISPNISPDGQRLAYIAPDEGVLNVWVRTVGKKDDRAVTKDRKRGIRSYFWAEDNTHLLYIQDKGGDENWHLYSVDLKENEERDLTPFEGVQARVLAVDPAFPNEILIGVNNRNPQLHDVFRVDLATGKLTSEAKNDQGFIAWNADNNLRIRGGMTMSPNGGFDLMVRDNPDSSWRRLSSWGPEDTLGSGSVAFTPDNKGLFILSSTGSNTSELRQIDLGTGKEKLLISDPEADVAGIFMHPVKHTVQAVSFNKDRQSWKVLDPTIEADFAAIRKIHRGDFNIVNRDHKDRTWLVSFTLDDGPVSYYAYDRNSKKAEFLFTHRKQLEDLTLARMEPVSFKATDGLIVHGYLTTPPGIPATNLPMVLNVHGGPWARDQWGFDTEAQWLANRGYAVLQVNYRGSTGYGKKYLNAANREWAGKMHQDLIDGVDWVVEKGIADPKRVAIFGGSYGGYATLVGLTFTPEKFCCGVDIVGPSNLITWMNNIPAYWKPLEPLLWERVGHPEKDAEFLKSRSPLFKVDRITKPILIGQGKNDPRVPVAESIQIVEALKKAGKTVQYVEYPDEGHGFARPENRLDFYAKAEKFLAEHLGGRYEQ
jgi:dipeptidyl aminopeptidase/acylaminoacyl peptidase